MNKNRITCAIAALALGFSSLAFSQDRDRRDDRDRRSGSTHGQDDRRDARHDDRNDARRDDRRDGAGPEHNWVRGGRLPAEYRSRQYVVDDWRGHHLRQPPRGYHWVQSGGDYVLAAIATGVIADILLNH